MTQQRIVKRYQNNQPEYRHVYTIEYRLEPQGFYTLWCTEHPANPFDASVVKCHLYGSGQVCIASGKEPRTREVAEAIAHYWMRGFSEYVRTGSFPDTGAAVDV